MRPVFIFHENEVEFDTASGMLFIHTVVFDYRNPEFLRELTLFDIDFVRNVLNNR